MTLKLKKLAKFRSPWVGLLLSVVLVLISNYYLQLSENEWSFYLASKFAFSWHTEKFLLGSLVLLILNLFIVSIAGSFFIGNLFYVVGISLLGIANAIKLSYRMEPIYPDDLKMIFEWSMLRDILGLTLFLFFICVVIVVTVTLIYSFYKSLKLPPRWQRVRMVVLVVTTLSLFYVSNFNQPNNLLKKAFDRSAKWIPYSQKMNYYNTGFMGGFLFNLRVDGMSEPDNYSANKIEEIALKYTKKADKVNQSKKDAEQPNVVYIMSESFSDPLKLKGIDMTPDPLKKYREVASEGNAYGQMLSQNYGGGTANIEFEALTGFSMGLLNPQMTTPYTMMLPKEKEFPSLVSTLKNQQYETTAIHPYNTSMYKRKDVYKTFGFDEFLDEKTMTHQDKLSKNGFISDESAFKEVLDIFEKNDNPQFVHLVTMQTHMPYSNKYEHSDYSIPSMEKAQSIENYAQDIAYTSDALEMFMKEIKELDRPTVVVFWGDHLPSIYPEEILKENEDITAHLTEYFVYDSRDDSPTKESIISPFYFPLLVSKSQGIQTTGFFELLDEMYEFLPAFERGSYYYNQSWQKEVSLSKEEEAIFSDYQLIQYDMISGKKYSGKFF
ncbi:LTA synthase family protein [Vagococcus fluvialis]|uniref:LTA synthase family protein n=1 Tax=Vagococcus fluvialis TaxID=2738 RepID=UPI001D0ABF8A|nr:LTA synthase family protein [Vagococcus fluvialis]UDM79252.1 LTA synthase family protein [Vagococcus fluvialis]